MKKTALCLVLLACFLLASCAEQGGEWYDFDLNEYISLGEYRSMGYTPAVAETVTEESVEAAIAEVLEAHSSEEVLTEGNYAEGDEIKMDFEGVFEGEVCRSSQGYTTTLGAKGFFADFEGGLSSLVGTPIGTEHKLSLTFLSDHADPDWAGKTLEFTLKIQRVTRYHNAVLDDAFVASLNLGVATVDEYRAMIRTRLEDRAREDARKADLEAVWSAVLANCSVKLYPADELESYVAYFNSLYESQAKEAGMETEDFMMLYYGITPEQVLADAKNVVKQDLVMYSLCKKESISFDEAEYQSYAETLSKKKGLESVEKLEGAYSRRYVEKSLLLWKLQEQLLTWAQPASSAPASSSAAPSVSGAA